MTPIELHPSELGYAFSYARTEGIVGWGTKPFLPPDDAGGDRADWFRGGEARLVAAGRLVGTPETGLNFTDEMTQAILALVNPGIVLLAQRKAGDDGVRTLTVHATDDDFVGLTRHADGMFELTRYDGMTAAAGAGAAFAGASLAPLKAEVRIESDQETLSRLKQMAGAGDQGVVVTALMGLGASEADATSAAAAFVAPAAAGVVSVLYCANNAIQQTEAFSVLTNAQDQTWIVFAPAGPTGPVILERSSAAALAARIAVGVAARLVAPG
jgi:hypothetical protein